MTCVGRKIASVEGFNYTPALKAKAGEDWTYEHIDHDDPQARRLCAWHDDGLSRASPMPSNGPT